MPETLIVIGAGAAGFFTAVNAARMRPGLQVRILEKTDRPLRKVRVSGGGRCNVTHACFSIPEMAAAYPRGTSFVKKTFHQFFTTDTVSWFEQRGVKLHTEPDGRMFPVSNSSQTIIDCLMREANSYGVEILYNREIVEINRDNSRWNVECSNGEKLSSDFVVVACGGYPKSAMFDWLRCLGHSIEEPLPSLFTFNMPDNPITKLMGVSIPDVQVRIAGKKLLQRAPVLITHWGLSGPAILKLSAWGARELANASDETGTGYRFAVILNWLPTDNENSLREKMDELRFELAPVKMSARNPFGLPQRFWEYALQQSGIAETTRWADLGGSARNKLIKNICAQELKVSGKTTFKEEFVTSGGIKLSEVDVQTMGSKKAPGLYFAGEILDVDGITGGYNFQHAWTSGFIAAKAIGLQARDVSLHVSYT